MGVLQEFIEIRAHHSGTATCSGSSQIGALPAGGTASFQPMTVSHLPGDGGPLSILSQNRCKLAAQEVARQHEIVDDGLIPCIYGVMYILLEM